ncbi:MAG: glutamine-hydrolyzing GMP synthase [Deltaproteobacteria bacterium RIFCSPLOWO2_12_FULL_44_12]|nr:MAG: glutamine-hydrolyzing GMP synthase [Deltaproteobacteria bacterium RIFCSPHIGHO2_01_FULL_43_49]OGQ16320.1 MAG: glutamine-hydrolyzing GMP synthase [Deltaproteobacteria bacterium RIFCSPHIGHO2_02_FULL_44_53]OGQ29280.1 MAG: glutamine-hydrolyzing GMP synthase [Deltaproteobacteria bacterium RIFCSPHIGHO2_12_FULL_44_21]OGQ32837.1 MAG: glutamine-hydrolyzing GMP synthase [Deltaproteobacteria bacterium RIFCSPLOWO2_01_FULL_45_74]OGQ41938.1 MAG: glutamine-hydrolyzing GMP synthase [Deltaproteobacteria 
MISPETSRVLVLDFGSQYTQLIARRIREAHIYCEIQSYNYSLENIRKFNPGGIILSGGPASVWASDSPKPDPQIYKLGIPILGICYGMQLIVQAFGGEVAPTEKREFGRANIEFDSKESLFKGISSPMPVWMSHCDYITKLPHGFHSIAHTDNSPVAALASPDHKIFGLQFHPEVTHTPEGTKLIGNFLYQVCALSPTWTMASFSEEAIEKIRKQVGNERVICALSGGVDSSVVAVLIHKAIGDRLTCIFVNNGLLRKDEPAKIDRVFQDTFHIPLISVNSEERFLKKLRGVTDPEAKRKIIGQEFIAVFDDEATKLKGIKFLAQGTLYPDVIESVSFKGPAAVIKSHHNVGALPEKMGLALVEPLRELFKDEVRELGSALGISHEITGRQPFPGPGLGIRIIGEITKERLEILRNADEVMMQEIKRSGWYNKVWQTFCILLPIKTVGVMGDERTYENVVALRAVESLDGMTADWAKLPYDLLERISNRVINEVKGINRVVLDISSKPPATIEWE